MRREYIELSVIIVIILLLFAAVCSADIQVLKNTNTDEVIMISEDMNIVSNAIDDEIVILPHDIEFYNLTEEWSMYILKNKKFTFNTAKHTKHENEKQDQKDKKDKKNVDQGTAKVKLIALGFNSDEANIILDIH